MKGDGGQCIQSKAAFSGGKAAYGLDVQGLEEYLQWQVPVQMRARSTGRRRKRFTDIQVDLRYRSARKKLERRSH